MVVFSIPFIVLFLTAFTATDYITFPPKGISVKWFELIFQDVKLIQTIGISLFVAAMASSISIIVSILSSYALVRYRFPFQETIQSLLLSPLSIPMIALAMGLLFFLANLNAINIFTLIFSHVVITYPYAVRTLALSLKTVNVELERAAVILGAGPLTTFFRVLLPMMKPGMIAAFLFSFLGSFNNVSVSLFLSRPGITTLPVKIFYFLETNPDPRISAVSAFIMIFSFAMMIALDRLVGLFKIVLM